jgi:deazaflavin-dependent oxidoreductase (nitroreductase family)
MADEEQRETSSTYRFDALEYNRQLIERYESSGGMDRYTPLGNAVVIIHSRGSRTGQLRKSPVVRVEHDGSYALVASKAGAPENPSWYYNLLAAPDDVKVQDGPAPVAVTIREAHGAERAQWWARAVEEYPSYGTYQVGLERSIPIIIATPTS